MGKQIVGMLTSYPGITQSDWLWQQSPQASGVWGNIQMLAQASQPDFLLMYQVDFTPPIQPQTRSLKTWLRQLKDPSPSPPDITTKLRGVPQDRILYLLREPPLAEVASINQHNYAQAQQYCGYVSGPDEAAPMPDYMPAIWYHSNSFRDLNELPPPEKINPCSWITSGISRTANHRTRLDFLRLVQSSQLPVDFYGRNLPTWVKSGGHLNNKWYGMAPYRYNLAIENYADNQWYASEKLWDALLAWCLPIYYGGNAADRLLPPGSFLRLPSLDEAGIAYIREVTANPDAWYAAKEAIAEARQIILHKLNLLNWLSDYVEKF